MGRGAWWAIVHVAAKRRDRMTEHTLVCNTKNCFFFFFITKLFYFLLVMICPPAGHILFQT